MEENVGAGQPGLRSVGAVRDRGFDASDYRVGIRQSGIIYRENEPAEYVYQVKSGAVRTYKQLSDGRWQIGAFHLVGDMFGLEAGEHRFTADAIVETAVRLISRPVLEKHAQQNPVVAVRLLHMTTANLRHVEDRLLLLGRKCPTEKVAAFLIEMDERIASQGRDATDVSSRHWRLMRHTSRNSFRSLYSQKWVGALHPKSDADHQRLQL